MISSHTHRTSADEGFTALNWAVKGRGGSLYFSCRSVYAPPDMPWPLPSPHTVRQHLQLLPACFPCRGPAPGSGTLAHPYPLCVPSEQQCLRDLEMPHVCSLELSLQLLKSASSPDLASWPPKHSPGSRSHSIQHETTRQHGLHSFITLLILSARRQTAECLLLSSGATSADLIQSLPLSLVTAQQSTREARRRGQDEVPECDFLELLMRWPLLK